MWRKHLDNRSDNYQFTEFERVAPAIRKEGTIKDNSITAGNAIYCICIYRRKQRITSRLIGFAKRSPRAKSHWYGVLIHWHAFHSSADNLQTWMWRRRRRQWRCSEVVDRYQTIYERPVEKQAKRGWRKERWNWNMRKINDSPWLFQVDWGPASPSHDASSLSPRPARDPSSAVSSSSLPSPEIQNKLV